MPIVINEIEIVVEVMPDNARQNAGQVMGNSSKEEIIKECVERVMEIINQKKER
jgi:hypothetical protein